MQKYYGLRLMRGFCLITAVAISLITVGGIGALAIPALVNGKPYDGVQSLIVLVIGGLISFGFYFASQLADIQLRNYQTAWRVLRQTAKTNELNSQILDLMTVQLEVMRVEYGIDKDVKLTKVIAQIAQRRQRLEQPIED